MNCIIKIAKTHRTDNYITPEDVTEALKMFPVSRVRRDLLEILGKIAKYGAEDSGLCAFIAYRGR
jgi:hypothetical protein